MDRRENGIVLVFQVSTSPATRRIGWIEGQLGKEPLARSIARCNLAQLRNVCGTQWRVIIDPVEVWGVPFLYQLQFHGPRRLVLPHLLDQLRKGRPVLGCGLWYFNGVERISDMGFAFYLIQNFCCGAGSNARQQLDRPKSCNPVPRVLAPSQDTDHVFDVGSLQEFEAAILHERNVASGQFNLKLCAMVRGSE